MAVWLFILPWLIRAVSASGVPGSAIEAALSKDVLLIAFERLGFADFYQASYASKSFRELVDPIVRFRYCIRHNGKTFLNYTAIIREMDALVQDAGKSGSLCRDSRALEGSFHFNCIKSILEARFGYCIEYAAGRLPKFTFSHLLFDILIDEHRIVALPYILDQEAHDLQWVYLIQGLVKLGRLDLLNRLTFPKVSNSNFEQLANIALPDALMLNVVKSLQGNYPITKLAKVLAWIHFGFPANPVPENCKVSLVFLQYMHERNMPIPRGWVFYCELEQASISFWLYLIQREAEEARALLDLVRRQGSGDTKYLAGAFYEAVQTENLCVSGIDFYQAMLIRFHSSPVCNEHIIRNYETMLDELSTISYNTACALLDCESYELMEKYPFDNKYDFSLEVIIDRIYRLGHGSLDSLLQKYLEYSPAASSLLKRLLQTKADDVYARLVWQSLQSPSRLRILDDHCCSAPLEALMRLAREPEISAAEAQCILAGLTGFWRLPKEIHALYTAMFWEAPEAVISYFFDQVPYNFRLDFDFGWRFLLVTKYSNQLCQRLIQHFGWLSVDSWTKIAQFRPDLAKMLRIKDQVPRA